jgi:PAS domain S-box-containing protein
MEQKKDFIIRSHQRCEGYGVERTRVYSSRILDGTGLEKRMEEKRNLISTAEPYLKQLYDFVKGSDFFSLLTDEEGCILSIIGDETILNEALSYKMQPGAFMDERNIGTNAMGTALEEARPLQVSGKEHFIDAYHRWTCSASPIRDLKGQIIGTIDLTGYSQSVNLHTLGMVVAAANAIENMMDIREYAQKLENANNFTETIMDSIDSGILTTDLAGKIIKANRNVADLFGYAPEELIGHKIWDMVEDWDKIKTKILLGQDFTDENVFVHSRKNKLQLNVSVYPVLDRQHNLIHMVLVFRDVKQVRRLANKIMGHKAIYTFDKIIGEDPEFRRIIQYAKKIADSRSNVLITGESGTGKELFAQAIHNYSDRHEEPFVALNCGAIPRNLIESELFGYEGGAFTGSKTHGQMGKFQIAEGGTIFLDEIGEMPLDMQIGLLRVLEEGVIRRVGSNQEIVVNVRVIAATNKNLKEEIQKGNFRKDLYYRLNVLPVNLMPLRHRKTDIPLLSSFFMDRISRKLNKKPVEIGSQELKDMLAYDWPGNVRELENFIELMVNTGLVPNRIPRDLDSMGFGLDLPAFQSEPPMEFLDLESLERNHILEALRLYEGNITQCARILGIGRSTLYRKLEQYGIDCPKIERRPEMIH